MYPPRAMPTRLSFSTTTSSHRYEPTIPPLRYQPTSPKILSYDRPTSTDNYPCTDTSPRRRPRAMTHKIYPVRLSPRPHIPLALQDAQRPHLQKAE